MAATSRPNHSFLSPSTLFRAASFIPGVSAFQHLTRLQDPNVIFEDNNGTVLVYSPLTGQQIPQGPASDGSGSAFSTSAVMWIIFCFVVGAPLLLLGFRGWRITFGAAIGTAAALASWAVIVNTLDNVGVSDVALTLFVIALFLMGFAFGLLEMTRVVAILALGTLGGLAIGVRVTLLRSGLLISDPDAFFANWLIIGVCGFAGSILVVWRQRYGILTGSASTGSFFCALGLDLVINQQSGMSRGLRYLCDRNSYHALDTITNGYSPPTTTVIILAVSLGVIPAITYAQWKVFKRSFTGAGQDSFCSPLYEPQELRQDEESAPQQSMDTPDTPTTEKPPKQRLSDLAKES